VRDSLFQGLGIAATLVYGAAIAWLYATAPRSLGEVATGVRVAAGSYQVDAARFDAALRLFRAEQFRAARDEWARADPAQRDARTQFYVAYAFYREGWGRVYKDDGLYHQGLEAVSRAIALSPSAPLVVADPMLQMHTAAELKAELEKGSERRWGDLNPLKLLDPRK
jgi:tetratricopeptide (TPR) repeat protein